MVFCFLILCHAACTHRPLPRNVHFDGRRYHNLERTSHRGPVAVLKWFFNRERRPWPERILASHGPKPPAAVGPGHLRVTFVGHSSVLAQADGVNVLFDPVWSHRVSPVSFAGPARVLPPGLRFEDLPPIHVVAVSHDHYDHMDYPTLLRLKKRHDPVFVVPLGCTKRLEGQGIRRVIELDWWQRTSVRGLPVVVVPARHSSGRTLSDRDTTLWAGFVLLTRGDRPEAPRRPVLFAGDTGHGRHFRLIRERFGPLRLALLPIGAYIPRWFMREVHMDPADAVQAHLDLRAARSVAIHHGTFPLADEARHDPPADLAAALRLRGLPPGVFTTLEEGFGLDVP